jgi:hypothetical protein
MKRALLTLFVIGLSVVALPARSAQTSADDERRAAITVLRAINTAEIAAKRTGGKYLPLSELLDHPAMGRVKPNFAVAGNSYTHAGAGVRLALSADATQYVVTVVSAAPTYTASFTDERGVIYTGKALE